MTRRRQTLNGATGACKKQAEDMVQIQFGTDFVAFSASWLSCCLLPAFAHGMSRLNSDLWDVTELEGSRSVVQESLIAGVRARERRGCNYLFSVTFFLLRALQTRKRVLEAERPPKSHLPNRTVATWRRDDAVHRPPDIWQAPFCSLLSTASRSRGQMALMF